MSRRKRTKTAWEKKGWVVAKKARMTPQLELKFNDEEVDNKNFSTSWITMMPADDTISGVAKGDDENQRDGRVYHIHSVHMRMFATAPAQTQQTTPFNDLKGRVVVLLDKQVNEAVLTPTDVFVGGLIEDFLAFRNLQHTSRFTILWDKKFILRRDGQTATNTSGDVLRFHAPAPVTSTFNFNKTFAKPIKVITVNEFGTIASISDNAIVVIGTANTTNMQLQYHSRVRFTG